MSVYVWVAVGVAVYLVSVIPFAMWVGRLMRQNGQGD